MAIPLMVVTPSVGFGELICQIMEEAGRYTITLAISGEEALTLARSKKPAVCVLDADLEDMGFVELVKEMLEKTHG